MLRSLIMKIHLAGSINECWQYITDYLRFLGYTKCLYARVIISNRETMNDDEIDVLLSTYGDEVDRFFIKGAEYHLDFNSKWARQNAGVLSWGVNRARRLNGEMSPEEAIVHDTTRDLGLIAGYTVSMPSRNDGIRSGFGLCFDGDQSDCDDIWRQTSGEILAALSVFETSINNYPSSSQNAELTRLQRLVLAKAAQGRTNQTIAQDLGIHRRTVEEHLRNVREKLQATSTLEAVVSATKLGLL